MLPFEPDSFSFLVGKRTTKDKESLLSWFRKDEASSYVHDKVFLPFFFFFFCIYVRQCCDLLLHVFVIWWVDEIVLPTLCQNIIDTKNNRLAITRKILLVFSRKQNIEKRRRVWKNPSTLVPIKRASSGGCAESPAAACVYSHPSRTIYENLEPEKLRSETTHIHSAMKHTCAHKLTHYGDMNKPIATFPRVEERLR